MRILALLLSFLFVIGCAKMTEEKRMRLAKENYREALQEFKEEDYGDAAFKFNEALKFMDYLTPEQLENARFLLAKSYFLDEEYVDAIIALEDYIFYYPKLPRTEEAFYMLVESYLNVAPDPYRDQEYTWKAIEKAKEFLTRFPNSSYVPKVRRLIEEAYKKIAKHELYIAQFYEDYGYYYAAARRYQEVLINFAPYISEVEVAYRYIVALLNTDKQVKMEKEKIKDLLEEHREKLKEAKTTEEKRAIMKRIKFLEGEIKRWEEIGKMAKKEALEAINRFREAYPSTKYYLLLQRELKKKGWKS